jgi:hypothetical protein
MMKLMPDDLKHDAVELETAWLTSTPVPELAGLGDGPPLTQHWMSEGPVQYPGTDVPEH